jgi:hypothetical protein
VEAATVTAVQFHSASPEVLNGLTSVLATQGFKAAKVQSHGITFEANATSISVMLDSYSGELAVSAKWAMWPDAEFSMSELLRIANNPVGSAYRDFVVVSDAGLNAGLERLARLFSEIFDAGIVFDTNLLHALKDQRRHLSDEMSKKSINDKARSDAAAAWAARDFPRYVKSMANVEGGLSPLESRQLLFAKNQLDKND